MTHFFLGDASGLSKH